ncbi:MAG: hypothetical protein ACYSSN_01680 [Planctomycetota bacterium]|jgi:hypothetical protein
MTNKTLFALMFLCSYALVPLCSLRYPLLINDLRACKALYNCRETFTDVMSALQIRLFMQNKPNFRKSQMNVNEVLTEGYEKMDTWWSGKNKPNSNPNKAKFKKAKMNVTSYITVDYENKPPIRPPKKQSQIPKRQNPMQTSLPQRIMKKTALSASGKTNPNKPNQTQSTRHRQVLASRLNWPLSPSGRNQSIHKNHPQQANFTPCFNIAGPGVSLPARPSEEDGLPCFLNKRSNTSLVLRSGQPLI